MATAPVWVVAGAPGAGKSTVAEFLLEGLRPVPALLDKDVLFAGFVEEVQRAHGRSGGEREGVWYDTYVKVHEYAGMTAAAAQIRTAGAPVMLVGPFTREIRDRAQWESWVAGLGGDPVHLVWVSCPPEVLRHRLQARNRRWDDGKLASWSEFIARQQPDTPPPVPHIRVDASARIDQTRALLWQLAERGGSRRPR